MYRQGHMGAPPPMLIPMRFVSSLMIVTHPLVTIIPLKSKYFSHKAPFLNLLCESQNTGPSILSGHHFLEVDLFPEVHIMRVVHTMLVSLYTLVLSISYFSASTGVRSIDALHSTHYTLHITHYTLHNDTSMICMCTSNCQDPSQP